jgi:mono/diheme cytochrome c family protein
VAKVAAAAAALSLVAVVGVFSSGAGAADEDGQAIFDQKCAGCHTIGGGDLAGPDLQGLADRRDQAWVEAFVRDPAAVIESGDPIAKELLDKYGVVMPNLGVSDAQLAALVAFLGFEQQAPPTTDTTPTEPEPAPAGDVDRGKLLFEGSERFDAGGPSCLSCHSVAGVGALGGGQLGPDLTGAFAKYGGEKGLQGVLEAVGFPTMAPIFSRKPLTADERADLVAFLESAADDQRSGRQAGKLVGLSAGVAAAIALLALVIWRRRLNGVRRSLVDRSTGK